MAAPPFFVGKTPLLLGLGTLFVQRWRPHGAPATTLATIDPLAAMHTFGIVVEAIPGDFIALWAMAVEQAQDTTEYHFPPDSDGTFQMAHS
ncbi:hypothetical protein [Novosphingobium sp. B-7]|uniref:hypothetical protein n=1 Tax=Novosphingobium sp. B-7 TaxID=1298855 RepID=UPI0011D1BDFE|nr:hypothetical protein [Novosphingobium sp. B-7]